MRSETHTPETAVQLAGGVDFRTDVRHRCNEAEIVKECD